MKPPRHPTNAFFIWFKDNRQRLAHLHWHLNGRTIDLTRVAAREWHAMTPAQKEPYKERARAEKLRYRTQKAAYEEHLRTRTN